MIDNGDDIECPSTPKASSTPIALISPSTPTTPNKRAPSPPRWRFVNEAKSTRGYSSEAAGKVVDGKSSDELGAKYIAPDISLYRPKEEKEAVGKLEIYEPDQPEEELLEGEFAGLPVFEPPSQEPPKKYREWDQKYPISPKKSRENEWFDGDVVDSYKSVDDELSEGNIRCIGKLPLRRESSNAEVFTGQCVLPKKIEGGSGNEMNIDAIKADQHATSSESMSSNEGNTQCSETFVSLQPNNWKAGNKRSKRERCLYLLVLLLLLTVVILGTVLGTKSNKEVAGAAAAVFVNSASQAPSIMPSLAPSSVIQTSQPSMIPSLLPSTECPANTTPFSINHPFQTTKASTSKWILRDACSGEVVLQCLPCSIGTVVLGGSSGEAQRQEDQLLTNINECIPSDVEYVLEVSADDITSCCGFDASSFVATFDRAMVVNGASSLSKIDGSRTYFGEGDAPCESDSPSTVPSQASSISPSNEPSSMPILPPTKPQSPPPSAPPVTSSPTQSPVAFIGECPEAFVELSYYSVGTRVELGGIAYECSSMSCGSYGFEPGAQTSTLWTQAWKVLGKCEGTNVRRCFLDAKCVSPCLGLSYLLYFSHHQPVPL